MKKIIKHLAETNDFKYNLLKTAEELQELSLILTQFCLKEERIDSQKIIDEIGDVKIRLKVLELLFNKDKKKIKKRILFKLSKLNQYIAQKKYISRL